MKDVLTFVLAGGKGERLWPLTRDRAKPAVPFAGHYRVIDFALSSCVHSDLRRIFILTQYKALSLEEHIRSGWGILNPAFDEFLETVAPQQRIDTDWYRGTADAIYQNWYCVERFATDHGEPGAILILAGDHVYKMDYRKMLEAHHRSGADVTVAVLRLHREEVRAKLGELIVGEHRRVLGFEEKPAEPTGLPGEPEYCVASLGIYVFRPGVLFEELLRDAESVTSFHDFGRNLLPSMITRRAVYAFPFEEGSRGATAYWRDVGTLDAYWEAQMELTGPQPRFDVFDRDWSIHTFNRPYPPAKITHGPDGAKGVVRDSLLSSGCIVSGGTVIRSVLSPQVIVHEGAHVEESILLDRVVVGRGCRICRAILDKRVAVPPGMTIGGNETDRSRFHLTEKGITVLPKGTLRP